MDSKEQELKRWIKKYIWFPKLYSNKDWDNSISPDESLIKMLPKKTSKIKKQIL